VSSELYNTCSANDEFQCLGATVIATTQIRNCSEGVNVLQRFDNFPRRVVYYITNIFYAELTTSPTGQSQCV